MKKLIVIAIVSMMVMGMAVVSHASVADGQWLIYFLASDQNGGMADSTSNYYGVRSTAKDVNYSANDTADAQNPGDANSQKTVLASFDNTGYSNGTYGLAKDCRPVNSIDNTWQLKLFTMATPPSTQTGIRLYGWNPSGTYDLTPGQQVHLIVTGAPAGVTLTDQVSGITYTNEQLNAGTVEFLFTADAVNGTSSTPTMKWLFNLPAYDAVNSASKAITMTLVPEPGSMLAMLSGLVGLVGYGIRRRK